MSKLDIKCEINRLVELLDGKGGKTKKREIVLNIDALEELYFNLTGEKLGIALTLIKEYPLNSSYTQSLADEVNRTANILRGLSKKIVNTYKSINWTYSFAGEYCNYNEKYLKEIMESFIASLGPKYYQEYKEVISENRVFYCCSDVTGLQITIPLLKNKSFILCPQDQHIIANIAADVHEFGHVFERKITRNSTTSSYVKQFNISVEIFSMLMERLFMNYLHKINFSQLEIKQLERDYYLSLLDNAMSLRLILNLNSGYIIEKDNGVVFKDITETIDLLKFLSEKDGYEYQLNDINLKDIVLYTYGTIISDVLASHYEDGSLDLKAIENAMFDVELYNSEEIIEHMPYMGEITDLNVLRKNLIRCR